MRRMIVILTALTLLIALGATTVSADDYGRGRHCGTYTVGPLENLTGIAALFGVSVQDIARANGIYNPNYIYRGQVLVIPCGHGHHEPPNYHPPAPYHPPYQPPHHEPHYPPHQPPVHGVTYYTVGYGDTLNRIAIRFGTTYQSIAAANNIWNPNLIYAGQTLIIPTW